MLFPNLLGIAYLWVLRYRQRHQLRSMQDWQLRDLGIKRADAERESRKPCWRP